MSERKPKRKLVTLDPHKLASNPKQQLDLSNAILAPGVDQVFSDSMSVISVEVERYKDKVMRGNPLNEKEVSIILKYVKAIVELSREGREITKERKLEKLTEAELLEIAKDFLSKNNK